MMDSTIDDEFGANPFRIDGGAQPDIFAPVPVAAPQPQQQPQFAQPPQQFAQLPPLQQQPQQFAQQPPLMQQQQQQQQQQQYNGKSPSGRRRRGGGGSSTSQNGNSPCATSMLLGEHAFVPLGRSITIPSSTRPSSFRSDGELFREQQPMDDNNNRHRRVLGFELHSTRHDRAPSEEQKTRNGDDAKSTSSSSSSSSPSSSPKQSRFFPEPGLTWKNSPLSEATPGREASFFASSVPLSSTGRRSGSGGVRLLRFSSSSSSSSSPLLPAWFPWIPTKSQILSLKVTELREACSQRGLAKSGKKAVLQDRLWEWTTEHQMQHQARLNGDYLTNWFEEDSNFNDPNAFLSERKNQNQNENTRQPQQQQQQQQSKEKPKNNDDGEKDGLVSEQQQYEFTESKNASKIDKQHTISGDRTPNSLAEWSRSVDTEMFKKRREEIHRQKRVGKKPNNKTKKYSNKRVNNNNNNNHNHNSPEATRDYLRKLNNAMKSSPSSPHAPNNKDAMELYEASKKADQLGETDLAIQLLESLLELTPNDARLYRRLSRMHNDQGNPNVARATLQKGLRLLPENAWLWHGMGQLERSHGRTEYAVKCFRRAIREDPTFAHSYHAWGVHEFSNGQIAKAMKILKKGIQYCPTNHRLHHALGDLYRGAKLLKDAERCYKRALEEGPAVSHGFALSALACVAYELGDVDEARAWLYRSIETNNGRHAQGWLALAQLEEAEGNMEQALTVCEASIIRYEKELVDAQKRYKKGSKRVMKHLENSKVLLQKKKDDDDGNNNNNNNNTRMTMTTMTTTPPNSKRPRTSNPKRGTVTSERIE